MEVIVVTAERVEVTDGLDKGVGVIVWPGKGVEVITGQGKGVEVIDAPN